MDNSSSDIFSNSDYSYSSPAMMDTCAYESMVSNTKQCLSRNVNIEVNKPMFPQYFSSLLEDCGNCILQSLDLISNLLANSNVEVTKLIKYMTDAIQILQMMSTFIKSVIESVSMSCGAMKTFPTTTGKILMIVFAHCKDSSNSAYSISPWLILSKLSPIFMSMRSESLYAQNVKHVENQLKDLFKTCHDLQLTYLMVLEKHFLFDLTEEEEMSVLLGALDINLKIGEMVQSLDVKTMAEQWKAYTMICEKHSSYLLDKQVYQNCVEILCSMIENNIETAVKINQEEKITLRSLKVASFNIKILMKMFNIFKHCTVKSFDCILELLIFIHLNSCSYQGMDTKKSEQAINLIVTTILSPTEALIRELLLDAEFLNNVVKYEIDKSTDDKSLGFIVLVISLLKASILLGSDSCKIQKHKLICCVYKILPFGHIWFNMGLKFKAESSDSTLKTVGVYEHLLVHTLALALTLNSEEMSFLEQRLYGAVLATDYITAMFSANLWALLSRYSSRQFTCSQFFSLCNIYQKLERKKQFSKSPQKVHLSYLIKSIFEAMHTDDKLNVYHQFSDLNKKISLWISLELNTFLESENFCTQDMMKENLKKELNKLLSSDLQNIDYLTQLMKLASKYNFSHDDELEDIVVRTWMKLCPKHNKMMKEALDKQCCLDFVEALVSLTSSMRSVFLNSANLVEILHVVSNVMENANTEMKSILSSVVSEISTYRVQVENKVTVHEILINLLRILFHETEHILRMRFISELKRHENDAHLNNLIMETNDRFIQETWKRAKHTHLQMQSNDLKEQLSSTVDFKYRHKCVLDEHVILLSDSSMSVERTSSKNFDFADIDTLLDAADSDSEPACKKPKFNTNDVENIVVLLETNASMLCDIKENLLKQYKDRIRNVCINLKNISN